MIDAVIHQPVRLRIMASLMALDDDEKLDFTCLRDMLEATDGNLGAHLAKLEAARYIRIEKKFVARKPKTFVKLTLKGRSAFNQHVEALEAIVRSARSE